MKRILWLLLATAMLLSLTACGDDKMDKTPADTAVVPLIYGQDDVTMLMDVNSGKTRQLTTQSNVYDALVMTPSDGNTVYYMDKSSADAQTATLYMLKGDIMTCDPIVIAENIWVYSVSFDGRVAAYMQEDVLYRVVDGGKPQRVADQVEVIEFAPDSNTLWYAVEDNTASHGDNVLLCHEDGTLEATDKLMSGWTHIWFQKDWTWEDEKLIVEGNIIDDMPWDGCLAETADQLAYVKHVSDSNPPLGTLMLYGADGALRTVSDGVLALQGSDVYFLSDGSLVYYTCEPTDIRNGTWWRYHNGENRALFTNDDGVKTVVNDAGARGRIKMIMMRRTTK